MTSTAIESPVITSLGRIETPVPSEYRRTEVTTARTPDEIAHGGGVEGGSRESPGAEQLLALISSTADVLLVYSAEGILQWASPSLGQVFGWCPREMLGRRFFLSQPSEADDLPVDSPWLQWCEVTSPSWIQRRATVRGDGRPCWVEEAVTMVRDREGAVTAAVVSARDVTAHMHAMEALADSEAHFRAVAESASDVAYHADPDGVLTWISEAVHAALGVDSAVACHRTMDRWVAPADLPQWQSAVATAVSGQSERVRVRMMPASGSMELWEISVHPVRGAQQEVVGVAGGWHKVAVQAGSDRRATVTPAPVVRATLRLSQGLVQWASPSLMTLLGWEPNDWIGHRLEDYVHPDDLDRTLRALAEDSPDERDGLPLRIEALDGSHATATLTTARMRRSDGRVTHVVAALAASQESALAQVDPR